MDKFVTFVISWILLVTAFYCNLIGILHITAPSESLQPKPVTPRSPAASTPVAAPPRPTLVMTGKDQVVPITGIKAVMAKTMSKALQVSKRECFDSAFYKK